MKLFQSNTTDIVKSCQSNFSSDSPVCFWKNENLIQTTKITHICYTRLLINCKTLCNIGLYVVQMFMKLMPKLASSYVNFFI